MTVARFTIAYWCVLIAAVLPILCAVVAKAARLGKPRAQGGFDNHDPRGWFARQTDWRARLNAAQANGFEGLPFFIGAVVIAHQLGAYQTLVDLLACSYIVLRLLYAMMYVADLATLRTVVWTLAFMANVAILLAGYR